MVELDVEEHVCQSCGVPMKPEDYAEGSEKGDFCSFCVVHSDRDAVKEKIADRIQDTAGKSREEAEAEAEDTMRGLNRWASG